ncbi:MAG: DEAD/DEAH box helicase [Chloroflexota bacterium]
MSTDLPPRRSRSQPPRNRHRGSAPEPDQQPIPYRRPAPVEQPPLPFDPAGEAEVAQFATMYRFPLDEFQREAIRTLLHGDSVMVAAPTGTGKTIVAEFGVWEAFKRTGRVLYTTPIKALSNQKYRDLRAIYGDDVGLLTGDVTENREARVIVMTTEILRNMLLQTPWDLDEVDCIIFDEIHYLADPERGTTWEESIILCPDHVQLICLSATVNNADEIAAWISRTHRPIRLFTHTERAVPLALHYFHDGNLHLTIDQSGRQVKDFPHTGGELRRQANRAPDGARKSERAVPEMDEPQPRQIIDALHAADMLPAIYFLFSRNDCQSFAERLAVMRPNLVDHRQAGLIEQTIDAILAGMRPEDRELGQVKVITSLARKGIGFHHAGLLPILKQLVEVLFGRGLMEVVFATDTLALGVNMPARTVVIGRMSKWDGRRRRALIPNEFQQMAGRAGRRGMDRFGHVVVPYSPWFTFHETLEIATGELHPVRSAFAVRYNTVLNLWDPPGGDRVRSMLMESLDQFQSSQRVRWLEEDIIALGREIDHMPHGCLLGLEGGDDLLEDYRRVTRNLTAAQGRERRLQEDIRAAERALTTSLPWPEPGRQALRRAFRAAEPGLIVHLRDRDWAVFLGRGTLGGVGRFLTGEGIELVVEYRSIDYLTDEHAPLPAILADPPDTVSDPLDLVTADDLAATWEAVQAADLPDLAGQLAAHRDREAARVATEQEVLAGELEEAAASVRGLVRERQVHPCESCARRKEHRDNLDRIDKMEAERKQVESRLAREIDAEDERIRGVIRGIRNVMHRFGYLYRGYPTGKADMLAEVFDNDGLILCELVDRGILDPLAPENLAEVFSWFSFDRDFRYGNRFVLPDSLVLARRRIEDVEHAVLGEERAEGLVISEGHNPNFYGAARAWCLGSTMAEIGQKIELSEGDLVMTFNKTIDLMRQVREMLADVSPDHALRGRLHAAERMLKRDIVEQSLSLGFAPIELPDLPGEAPPPEPPAAPKPRAPRKQAGPAADTPAPAAGARSRRVRLTAEPAAAADAAPPPGVEAARRSRKPPPEANPAGPAAAAKRRSRPDRAAASEDPADRVAATPDADAEVPAMPRPRRKASAVSVAVAVAVAEEAPPKPAPRRKAKPAPEAS